MANALSATEPRTDSAAPTRSGLILALVCIAQFMVVLDISIVNVALPDIRSELHMSVNSLQWIINAYTLTFAGFLLLGGRAADLYGRRKLFLAGLLTFALTSLAAGLAQSGGQLIGFRAAQGIGGAVLSPATLTILTTTFTEPKARMRAIGTWSAIGGMGAATGVIAGGVLTDLLSWRWIFLINVPIGIATAAAARLALVESRVEGEHQTLDWGGAFTVTAGLSSLVYGIVSTDSHGWGSGRVLLPVVAGIALLAAFVVIETRHRNPLAPLRLFKSRPLVGANLIMVMIGGIMFGTFFFLSQYAQDVLGWSPLKTGFAFLPMPVAVIIGTQISSRIVARTGAKAMLVAGTSLTTVGLVWIPHFGLHSGYLLHIGLPGALITFGIGLCFVPVTLAATNGVPPRDAGLASGLINTTRQIGGSVGLAVLATIASSRTAHLAATHSPLSAQVGGYNRAYTVAIAYGVAALVIAATVIPRTLKASREPVATDEEITALETV